ncbi:MAG TPA: diguanylate cyclase [Lichenihabitans sp.]|jgi:diguanylate cyclase (GGDEF)-like protein/PAS domain S-box-containing protein|nr:diguanylate cyclase [Lichenihabitans sp.]
MTDPRQTIDVDVIGAPAFAIAVRGEDFVYTAINRRLSDVAGITPQSFVGNRPHDCLPGPIADHLLNHYRICVETRSAVEFQDVYALPGGTQWWQTTVTPVFDAGHGEIVSLIGVASDITARKQAEQAERETSARLSLVMDVLEGGFWHLDLATQVFDASPKLTRIVAAADRPASSWAEYLALVHPDDVGLADVTPLVLGRTEDMLTEYRVVSRSGRIIWLQCKRRLLRTEFNRPDSIIGVVVDISEQKRVQAILRRQAMTDSLTRLYNRRGFEDCATLYAAKARADGLGFGVVLVDLDYFKPVNDRHGHAIGDAVLREVARRLAMQVRASDIVSRMGGDEFAILVADVTDEAIPRLAERIVRAVEVPIETPAGPVSIGASVGCARTFDPDVELSELLARADRALYDIKDSGRGAWKIAA